MKTLLLLIGIPLLGFAQSAQYPGTVTSPNQLRVAANRIQTTLATSVGTGDTSILVTNPAGIPNNGLITIDTEIMAVCGIAGQTLVIGKSSCPNADGRGFDGTTTAPHVLGAGVSMFIDAWHHNTVAAEVIAIETALGPNLANVLNTTPQAAHAFLGGPVSGGPATPTYRALQASDLSGIGTLTNNTTGTSSGFTGNLLGDVTGTQSTTIVLRTNGVPFAPSATIDATIASNITSGMLDWHRLPTPTLTTLGGVRAANCLGTGQAVVSINSDGTINCGDAGGGGGGNVIGPGSVTAGYVAIWGNSPNTLTVGLPVSATPGNNTVVQANSSGVLAAGWFPTTIPSTAAGITGYTFSGNGTVLATSTGGLTPNDCVKIDASGNFVDAGTGCGSGQVSSVTLHLPASTFATGSSLVGGAATVTGSYIAQSPNLFLAGPTSGSAVAPDWRSLVAADVALAGTITNNTSGTAAGITGLTTLGTGPNLPTMLGGYGVGNCVNVDADGTLDGSGAPIGGNPQVCVKLLAGSATTGALAVWGNPSDLDPSVVVNYAATSGNNKVIQANGSGKIDSTWFPTTIPSTAAGITGYTFGYDSAGTGTKIAVLTGSFTNGNCVAVSSNGNFVDNGTPCGSGGGGGTVTSVAAAGTGIFSFTGSPVLTTGTLTLTQAGTSGGVPYFSNGTTLSTSAALAVGQFVLGGGAGAAPATSFSVVPIANGGTATSGTLTGIVRGGNPFTASELSGDATTSGSNVATVVKVHGVTYPTTGASFDALPILTASNTVGYYQINGGSSCGDATHGISYNASTHLFGCQSITGSAAAGGAPNTVQFNNASALGGISSYTSNGTTTISGDAAAILDLHLGATTGLLLSGSFSSGILKVATSTGVITSVAAPTGAIVGTSDTQTLTNKSIDASEITSGLLPIVRGGTGQSTATAGFDALSPMTALGDLIYGGASGSRLRLAGNITATQQFLCQTGTGSVSAAPAWCNSPGGATSVVNDTNVTGSIAGSVLTLGWTGTLAAGRLNSNVVQAVTNDPNIQGTISSQNLTLAFAGQLSVARGGTGQSTVGGAFNALSPLTTLGDMLYENATPAGARLAGNTTTTRQFLRQQGTGSISAAPAWDTLTAGDIAAAGTLSNNTSGTAAGITGKTFSGSGTVIATSTGTLNNGNCVLISSGNFVDSGGPCGGGSGSTAWSALTSGTNSTGNFVLSTGSALSTVGSALITTNNIVDGVVATGIVVDAGACGILMDGLTSSATANSTNLASCISGTLANGTIFTVPPQGMVIKFPPGIAYLASPIVISKDNIKLLGAGGFTNSSLCYPGSTPGACLSNSVLRATGGGFSGNYMLTWDGTTNARGFVDGPGIQDLDLDGNNLAAGIVRLKYVNGGVFSGFSFHDWVGTAKTSNGLDVLSANANASGTCGNGGGQTMFQNGNIQSYRGTGTNGVRLGDPAVSTNDVCSMKFANISVANNNYPGNHSIWVASSDSNQFVNMSVAGFSGTPGINTLLATSATTATLTLGTAHNMPSSGPGSSNDGIYLVNVCTSNNFDGNFHCTSPAIDVAGLEGTLTAAYISSTQIAITGAYGLTNGATYYVAGVHGADLELGVTNTTNMFAQMLTTYGVHNPGNNFGLLTGWNWSELSHNQQYSRPGGNTTPAIGVDGSLYGLSVRSALPFQPVGAWPNSLVSFSSTYAPGGTVPDFSVVMDFTGAAVTTSTGYTAIKVPLGASINSAAGSMATTFTNGEVHLGSLFGTQTSTFIDAPTSQPVNIYSGGSLTATFDSSHRLRLPSLAASQCLTTDGSSNITTTGSACGGGGAATWASLTSGTNTNAGTFAYNSTGVFTWAGATGNTAKLQLSADFSAAPSSEAAGMYINMVYPGSRGGANYYGIRIDTADTSAASAPFKVTNTGNGDSYYAGNQGGGAGGMSSTSYATDLNYNSSAFVTYGAALPCTAGTGCELTSNANLFTRGAIIYDWSFSASKELALEVANVSGGVNAVARFANFGDNHMNLRFYAGNTSQQEEGICFDRYDTLASPCLWFLGSTASATVTQTPFHLEDRLNSRTLLSATNGGSSRIKLDQGLLLPTGSGALQILDGGGTAKNVLSISGTTPNAVTTFGADLQFDFYTSAGSGPQMSILNSGAIRPKGLTVGTIPSCGGGTDNAIVAVTDQNNGQTAFGNPATSGGTAHVLLHCNGAGWTVMAN